MRFVVLRKVEKDVYMIWKDLYEKCILDKVFLFLLFFLFLGLFILFDGDVDLDDGVGFLLLYVLNDVVDDIWGLFYWNNGGDGVVWGDFLVVRDDDGGWGVVGKGNDSNEVDGYD